MNRHPKNTRNSNVGRPMTCKEQDVVLRQAVQQGSVKCCRMRQFIVLCMDRYRCVDQAGTMAVRRDKILAPIHHRGTLHCKVV